MPVVDRLLTGQVCGKLSRRLRKLSGRACIGMQFGVLFAVSVHGILFTEHSSH